MFLLSVYKQGAQLIDFWLKPAVVALGVPLYLQLDAIKRLWLPIVLSQFVGCLVGIVSVVFVAQLCGAPDIIVLSMASKSVTTPIAMEVTQSLGGIPSLTAAVVVVTGIIGALVGFKMLSYGHVIVLSHKVSLWVLPLMLWVHQQQWHIAVSMVLLRA